ncbi:MAG: hypothetical protein ACAH83_00695 [Alphaproteobacteria bacterium]
MTQSKFIPFYTPSWPGVLRSVLWCFLFIWLAGKLVPPLSEEIPLTEATKGSNVIPMLTIFDDHRTVRQDFTPDPSKRHIAWITDSSGVVIPKGEQFETAPPEDFHTMARAASEILQNKHKMKNFDVEMYPRLGMRPVDSLVFALLAMQQKPDLIVLPINLVWTFSHYQVANKTSSFNLAPKLWVSHPELWYMVPLFCSPTQLMWAAVGSHFAIVEQASPFKNHLSKKYRAGSAAPVALGLPKTNVWFWIVMNILDGNAEKVVNDNAKLQTNMLYREVIAHNVPNDKNSFATLSFRHALDILKANKIPVLIYTSPVANYFYGFPETAAKIKETEDYLEKTNRELEESGIRILAKVPEDVRKSIVFRKNDGFHADDPGKLNAYLADQIWLMMKPKQQDTKQKP